MKSLQICSLLLVNILLFPALAHAQSALGTVRAFSVIGDVSLRNDSTMEVVSLQTGREFTEGFTVLTGAGSSVVLVQSNGATITLEENSSLTVSEFLQDPYDTSQGRFTNLEEDPSTSRTRIRVNYGEAAGEVKRLRSTSSYNIDLPTGSAGIRGTTWRVVVRVNFNTNQIFVTFTTAEGLILFEHEGTITELPGGREIETEGSISDESTEDNIVVLEFTVGDPTDASESETQNIMDRIARALENASREQGEPQPPDEGDEGDQDDSEADASIDPEEAEAEADDTPQGDEQTTVDEFSPSGS